MVDNTQYDLTEIESVGPARADELVAAGYETVPDVANADEDDLDALFDTTSGEALVSNAQAVVSDSDESVGVVEGGDASVATDDEQVVTIEDVFTDVQEYYLIAALSERATTARRQNNFGRLEDIESLIASIRTGGPYELTAEQIAIAYTAANEKMRDFQSTRGISNLVAEIRDVRDTFQDERRTLSSDA
jgi:hypothetical protein